jgi:hypothetical protein
MSKCAQSFGPLFSSRGSCNQDLIPNASFPAAFVPKCWKHPLDPQAQCRQPCDVSPHNVDAGGKAPEATLNHWTRCSIKDTSLAALKHLGILSKQPYGLLLFFLSPINGYFLTLPLTLSLAAKELGEDGSYNLCLSR